MQEREWPVVPPHLIPDVRYAYRTDVTHHRVNSLIRLCEWNGIWASNLCSRFNEARQWSGINPRSQSCRHRPLRARKSLSRLLSRPLKKLGV